MLQVRGKPRDRTNLLVVYEDLECTDNLCQRNALVCLPRIRRLDVVYEDDEVLSLALVVDLGLLSFTANHDC